MSAESLSSFPRRKRNIYLLIILLLTAFNLVVYTSFIPRGPDGEHTVLPYSMGGSLASGALTMLIAIPLVSLLSALVIALIPYNELPYANKYLRSWLISWMVICLIFAVIGVVVAMQQPVV